ncbi:MAG: glycosyltransferase family 4 protein [Candidatus Marinimicrobia bacterium]|nr:glycosyltransferase family 4 protein [Candidatus Neomarinimicrobiota bacterium]
MTNHYTGLARGFPLQSMCVLTVKVPNNMVDSTFDFPVYRSRVTEEEVRRFPNNWTWYKQALQIINREKIDVILCGNFRPFSYVAYWIHHKTNLPYFIFFHGDDLLKVCFKIRQNRLKKRFYSRIIDQASGFIANSQFTAKLISTELGVERKPIVICNPGVRNEYLNLPLYPPFKSRGCHLLSVGRLAPRKNVDKVIEALPLLVDKIKPLHYTVVGRKDPSAPYALSEYKAIARKLGVEDIVSFIGFFSDQEMQRLYQQCDLFVMVSLMIPEVTSVEGFGIVFLEANAFGKPVIGSRSGGIPDAIIPEQTGLIVEDPSSVDEIADKILHLYNNQNMAEAMGRVGHYRVNSKFRYDRIAPQLVHDIHSVLRV